MVLWFETKCFQRNLVSSLRWALPFSTLMHKFAEWKPPAAPGRNGKIGPSVFPGSPGTSRSILYIFLDGSGPGIWVIRNAPEWKHLLEAEGGGEPKGTVGTRSAWHWCSYWWRSHHVTFVPPIPASQPCCHSVPELHSQTTSLCIVSDCPSLNVPSALCQNPG